MKQQQQKCPTTLALYFHFNLGPILPFFCPEATLRSRDGKNLTSGHPVMATSHTHFQCQVSLKGPEGSLPFL